MTSLVLTHDRDGDAAIRMRTARRVGAVEAHPADDPPRLVIELFESAPRATATPRPRERVPARHGLVAAEARAAAADDALAQAIARVAASRAAGAPPPAASVLRVAAPAARPQPTPTRVAARSLPTAIPAAPARERLAAARSTAPVAPARSGAAPPAAPGATPGAAPRAAPAAATAPETAARRDDASGSPHVVAALPGADAAARDATMPCRLTRKSGVAFCAPDPAAAPYAASPDLARLAAALADGDGDEGVPAPPTDATAAALYLAADRELVASARSRHLLAAIDAYRRALRRFPRFVDAPRARLNVVFAYRTIGFRGELAAAVAATAADPGAALALAAAGDAALDGDDLAAARWYFERARASGGIGVCLAQRGAAAIAIVEGDAAAISRETARLAAVCPRVILDDADTRRLDARVRIAAGDAAGALAILARVRSELGPHGGALLMEDTAAAAAAAGDETTARHLYEQLVAGLLGGASARRAAVALARMDAADGDLDAGLRRLNAVGSGGARDALARGAVTRALDRGAAADAVALLHEQRIDPAALAPADQIRLAASYRALGLPNEGERLLGRLRDALGADAPSALWDEWGRAALARGDAPRALAVGDEWVRVRGADEAAAANALRARALASLGDVEAARAACAAAARALDAAAARALRVDVAGRIRPHDAAAARDLLRDALAMHDLPAESATDTAAVLRAFADAAEASGDDDAAVEALTRLTEEYPKDPGAADAAYRLARLRAGREGGAAARQAYESAAGGDALERRVVAASEAYEKIVVPFERPLPEPLAAAGDAGTAAARASASPRTKGGAARDPGARGAGGGR